MCELFGISSAKDMQINDYLKSFYSHCDEHPHGWGLAVMQSNQIKLEKQPIKAYESEYLKQILSTSIYAKHAFAHIRLATIGIMDSKNCHPFTKKDNNGRTWTLIHNGTIFDYEPLNKFLSTQTGDTDSERILLFIVEQVNSIEDSRGMSMNKEQRFNVINSLITSLAKSNKLNLMIYDGEIMYVHINCNNSLYFLEKNDSLIFSTRPLTDDKWQEVQLNTVYGVNDGKIEYNGNKHDNEYVITDEHIEFIFNNLSPTQRETIINDFGGLENVKKHIYNNQR